MSMHERVLFLELEVTEQSIWAFYGKDWDMIPTCMALVVVFSHLRRQHELALHAHLMHTCITIQRGETKNE